ncbi:restriction endonuclease subunit S [Aliarcobacter butzleri]|uniref:Restriction endonuclease subunit S n=1 Tax=Aliarcobacter butzleri TaxID=28197 RepID=A0AAW7PP24_9BACT|nr:restriction endonuclease subunit S [Aliarcobacter butzleri]MDN5062903.1 restriction endonuclease subunit S [Aliarcobacter butzleri]MDN5066327.1 restriction endonuclease subunit S [Aliarcobacter butzleri]
MIDNLPNGWKVEELGNCVDILDNQRIPLNNQDREERIKGKNISELFPYYGATQQVGYIDDFLFDEELVLLGEDGVMFYDKDKQKAYLINGKSWVNNHAHVLRAKKNITINKYLVNFLNTFHYKGFVSGATRLKLNQSRMAKIPIPIPPLEQQKKIVKVLDLTSNLIEKQKELLKKYDLFLKSKFIEMFGDPILNPMGWEIVKLGSLMTIRRGASPRPIDKFIGNDVSWIKIGDGSKGNDLYIENTKIKIIKEGISKSVLLKRGSLIFANCGISLGFCRILKIDGCIHDGWLSFENIDEKLNKIFILKLINHSTQRLRESASGGTQPNLNTTIMKNFNIYLPPLKHQNKFALIVEKIETIKEKENQKLKQFEDLHNSMMNKAFKGDIK